MIIWRLLYSIDIGSMKPAGLIDSLSRDNETMKPAGLIDSLSLVSPKIVPQAPQ